MLSVLLPSIDMMIVFEKKLIFEKQNQQSMELKELLLARISEEKD